MPLISAAGLRRTFPQGGTEVVALQRIDLRVETGEFLILAGESGSGKTTLLNLIGGLDRPSSGRLVVDGVDLGEGGEADLTRFRRERVGFVFQDFCLVRHLTALANVTLPLLFSRRFRAAGRARDLLVRFRLEDRLRHRPGQMSRGEMQRVALARALVHDPILLLADEPAGNLDHENGEILWNHMLELHRAGEVTIVAATHDPEWQKRADRIVTLRRGSIVADTRRPERR
ncbi:MAG: ABC transporter ATP-binding protein [Acidobacteria bacterium]|nr:ABC transporter ATP-binding protein [Acidobacteriota bacterium]